MALFDYLKSTILSKVVMAVTGIILVLFLIGHSIGNLQVYIGRETFNAYAHFLQGLGELLWLIRIVLFLALIFHIITSIRLKFLNLSAKPDKYAVKKYLKANFSGRTMIWSGIVIFLFLVLHLGHFTTGTFDYENFSKNPKNLEYYSKDVVVVEKADLEEAQQENLNEGKSILELEGVKYSKEDDLVLFARPDAYSMVIKGFRQPFFAISYIILVIIIGFHLSHAIQSSPQTLGINHPKYNNFLRKLGPWLSTILVLCYISIPITIFLGLVGGEL